MEEQRRKVYVEVEVTHRVDGSARPHLITFENGEKYEIDRVIQRYWYPLHGTSLWHTNFFV